MKFGIIRYQNDGSVNGFEVEPEDINNEMIGWKLESVANQYGERGELIKMTFIVSDLNKD